MPKKRVVTETDRREAAEAFRRFVAEVWPEGWAIETDPNGDRLPQNQPFRELVLHSEHIAASVRADKWWGGDVVVSNANHTSEVKRLTALYAAAQTHADIAEDAIDTQTIRAQGAEDACDALTAVNKRLTADHAELKKDACERLATVHATVDARDTKLRRLEAELAARGRAIDGMHRELAGREKDLETAKAHAALTDKALETAQECHKATRIELAEALGFSGRQLVELHRMLEVKSREAQANIS